MKKQKCGRSCDSLLKAIMTVERPITMDEACALRLLLFGDLNMSFGNEWTEQSFHFRRNKPLSYGIIQKKAGPCGVLAAVQAFVLQELLFGHNRIDLKTGLLRPNLAEKRMGLSLALTSILWQAGEQKRAIVAVRQKNVVLNTSIFRGDGILEYLHLKYFTCKKCLLQYYYNFISEMMEDNSGSCILFLYSVIMTHGIEKIKSEMDYPDSHLIGIDGYCSQEIVNLILVGKGVPNLFDGNLELNSGGSENSLFHGIPQQSLIGLLSLLDYQNTCPVGSYYKYPVYPIYLLLCDSHFTVLFGTSSDILHKTKPEETFTLYHYDGLQRKNKETAFVIKLTAKNPIPITDDNFSSVKKCIYTRWPHVVIESENEDNPETCEE